MTVSPKLASLAVLLALALSPARAARADVRLAVSPETLTVAPGASFTLELRVPVAGSAFNGYDAVVEYDPAKLTFQPTSPLSLQEGPSMKNACGNTFHLFKAAGDSLSISHVLLCAGVSLTGPADLYWLHFKAAATPGVTTVRLRRVQFYDAGIFVDPAVTSGARVNWGVVLDVGGPPRPGAPRLAVRANPARGEQWLDVSSPADGEQSLVVYDTLGRVVRRLESDHRAAGAHSVRWDGRDDGGRPVPPGVYPVRFSAAGRVVLTTLVRLP